MYERGVIMKVYNVSQSQQIDKMTIERSVPSQILMENAAFAVVHQILKNDTLNKDSKILVCCGKGNNGGDGLAVARLLHIQGYKIHVHLLAPPEQLSHDAKVNYDILMQMNIPIVPAHAIDAMIQSADIIIDGIFGIGFTGTTKNAQASLFHTINQSHAYVYAIDMPSGVLADTGQTGGTSIQADETITFGFLKPGHLLYPAKSRCGKISIYPIGFLDGVKDTIHPSFETYDKVEANYFLPKREPASHKGVFGKTLIIGGSKKMEGAFLLACKAAFKAGCGYVYGLSVAGVVNKLANFLPEAIGLKSIDTDYLTMSSFDLVSEILHDVDVIAIGPGLGQDKHTQTFLFHLLNNSPCPIIIDADGLNLLHGKTSLLPEIKVPLILTPHMGEMAHLIDLDIDKLKRNKLEITQSFALTHNVIVCLKDADTIVVNTNQMTYINPTGSPALAKAGSGDVLTGMIAGLLAQNKDPYVAAKLGVYFHGQAGEKAGKRLGIRNVLASDLYDYFY